ncbi:MAG TPA: PKD domain-containing protein [Solirubrobacteraceae bacterium]|nr:PKD domain-containing protein [Solirubrobacteraceae bacterium]
MPRLRAAALPLAALALAAQPAAAAGDWTSPVELAAPTATIYPTVPSVAMAPNGDATVVWEEDGPCDDGVCTERQVKARRISATRGLGDRWRLSPGNAVTGVPQDANLPQVVVDGAGRAWVAWLRPDSLGDGRIQFAMLDEQSVPAIPAQEVSPSGEDATALDIAVNDAGQGMIVWLTRDTVYARRFTPAGLGGGVIKTVDALPSGHMTSAIAAAVDGAGIGAVAWTDLTSGTVNRNTVVKAQRIDVDLASGPVHQLDTWPQTVSGRIAMDVQPTGRFTVAWSHFGATGSAPESLKGAYITNADVLEPFPLPIAFDEPTDPALAVAPDGRAVVVYASRLQPLSATKNVLAKRISADGVAGSILFLSPNDIDALDPQVDIAPDGTAFAGWYEEAAVDKVMAVRIPATGQPDEPETLAQDVKNPASPGIAAGRNGDAVAALAHRFPLEHSMRAVHFDGTAPRITTFGVATRGFVGQDLWFGAVAEDALSALADSTWTFGDGSSANAPVVSHAFRRPGTYAITLRVQDRAGNEIRRTGAAVISTPAQSRPGGSPGARRPAFTVGTLRARVARRTLLRRGLALQLTASAPTAFTVQLVGRLRGARLATTGDLVLAERRLPAATGTRSAQIKVSRALRRLVRRGTQLRVQITATGADGGTASATKRVRVRR